MTQKKSIWFPQEGPQTAAITADWCPILLYGGGKYSGKTQFLLGDYLQDVETYKVHWQGILFRRALSEFTELKLAASQLFPKVGAKWMEKASEWRFLNGAILRFRFLEKLSDISIYEGQGFPWLGIDELGDWEDETAFFRCLSLNRYGRLSIPNLRLRATCNPGGKGHCLPYGEVLTPSGWKDIKDFKINDPVYTVDKSGQLISTNVDQVHSSNYSGEIIEVKCRGFYATMTPNHKVAKVNGVVGDRNTKFSLVPFEKLPGQASILRTVDWIGEPIGTFTCPVFKTRKLKLIQPLSISGIHYAKLMGWMLSEGSLHPGGALNIAQLKPRGRKIIEEFLREVGFKYTFAGKTGYYIQSKSWWAYFKQFGKCRNKYIPERLKNASKEELEALFEALMEGDGHWATRGKSGQYYTLSKHLADDVLEIALKLGYVTYLYERKPIPNRVGPAYVVCFKTVKSGGSELLTGNHVYGVKTQTKRKSNISRKHYEGPVYCLGIKDTHTFVVRQKGSVWISGNSWLKKYFIDPAPEGYTPIYDETLKCHRIFIPARLEDNKIGVANDPNYEHRLMRSGSEALVRALRYGDWNIVTGSYFTRFTHENVIEPFTIPDYWTRFMALDPGSSDPFCYTWWAVSDGSVTGIPRDALICYREWYGEKEKSDGTKIKGLQMPIIKQVEGIKKREQEEVISDRVAGHDLWDTKHGPSGFEHFAEHGITFRRAEIKRKAGWKHLSDLMDASSGAPMVYWFTTCRNCIEHIPLAQHDPHDAEDVEDSPNVHTLDSIRYGVMSRNIVTEKPVEEIPFAENFKPPTLDDLWKEHDRIINIHRR